MSSSNVVHTSMSSLHVVTNTVAPAVLQKGTTADDMKEYLSHTGIPDARCTLLSDKDGRIFNTVAFRVSCDLAYKDLFYNEANWPKGCELRD